MVSLAVSAKATFSTLSCSMTQTSNVGRSLASSRSCRVLGELRADSLATDLSRSSGDLDPAASACKSAFEDISNRVTNGDKRACWEKARCKGVRPSSLQALMSHLDLIKRLTISRRPH